MDSLSNITNHRDSWKILKGWALVQAGGRSVPISLINLTLYGHKIITNCCQPLEGSKELDLHVQFRSIISYTKTYDQLKKEAKYIDS